MIILFFTYGHIYSYLKEASVFNVMIGRHRYLVPILIVISIVGLYFLLKKLRDPAGMSTFMNIVAIIAIMFPPCQTISYEVRLRVEQAKLGEATNNDDCGLEVPTGQQPPDIYYIMLDAYARQDDLAEVMEIFMRISPP